VGPLALPKKDKIDLWHLAISGLFALGLFALQVGPFALIIKNDIRSLYANKQPIGPCCTTELKYYSFYNMQLCFVT
jgi:hypothetical protein